MKKINFTQLFLLTCLISSLIFSCQELNPVQNFGDQGISKNTYTYNYKSYGDLVYKNIKYYYKSIDPYTFMPEISRDKYKEELKKLIAVYKSEHWTVEQANSYLIEKGHYSKQQGSVWLQQHNQLVKFLTTHPSSDNFTKWVQEREQEIINSQSITTEEKSKLLNERAAINSVIQYKLEMMPDEAKNNSSARVEDACGFWEKLSCWVGYISGIAGLGGQAGDIAALFTDTTRLITSYTGIGAAIGVAIGVAEAIQGCNCDMNNCTESEGINFDYVCYFPGNSLTYQVWGYGNITPEQFEFQFYKNNDLSNGSNFFGGFGDGDHITLSGSTITDNNVQSIALRSINYCSGDAKTRTFGWFNLSDLGKPFFIIDGPNSVTWANAPNVNYLYTASGAIQKTQATTITWEVIPSGYPGYSATGTIVLGNNGTSVFVRWDSTPGIAFVKCTATSPCGTIVDQYTVTIH